MKDLRGAFQAVSQTLREAHQANAFHTKSHFDYDMLRGSPTTSICSETARVSESKLSIGRWRWQIKDSEVYTGDITSTTTNIRPNN